MSETKLTDKEKKELCKKAYEEMKELNDLNNPNQYKNMTVKCQIKECEDTKYGISYAAVYNKKKSNRFEKIMEDKGSSNFVDVFLSILNRNIYYMNLSKMKTSEYLHHWFQYKNMMMNDNIKQQWTGVKTF